MPYLTDDFDFMQQEKLSLHVFDLFLTEEPNWLFPAIILLALGGNQIRMSSLQLADLFPANKATALTILSGMYATSASLFLVFQASTTN